MFPELRPCPHCKHQISPYKCYCPKCGKLAPDTPSRTPLYIGIAAAFTVLLVGLAIYVIANQNNQQTQNSGSPVRVFTP